MADHLTQMQDHTLLDGVRNLRKTGTMSDVELECVGGVIRAHKIILSSVNPYFAALFNIITLTTESSNRIQFDYNVNAMEMAIDFLYSISIPQVLGDDYVLLLMELLEIARVMDISSLFDHYLKYYINTLSVDHFLTNLKIAEKYGEENTTKRVIEFIVDHIEECIEEDSFLHLHPTEITEIIKLAKEKKIQADISLTCILKWGQFNHQCRSNALLTLIKDVHLSELTNNYLHSVFQTDIVKNCDQLRQVLTDEAIHRLKITTQPDDDSTNKTLHMTYSVIITQSKLFSEKTQSYNFNEKLWSKMKTVTFSESLHKSVYTITSKHGTPYYFSRSFGKIVAFDPSLDRSITGGVFANMPRFGVSVGTTFCFFDYHVIAQFCPETRLWNKIPIPYENGSECTILSVGGKLFLYNRANFKLSVYSFGNKKWKIESDSSEPLTPIWSKCLRKSCKGKLFFLNVFRELVTYDCGTQEWKKNANFSLNHGIPEFANCDDSIVVFRERSLVIYYDETGTTEVIEDGMSSELKPYFSTCDICLN